MQETSFKEAFYDFVMGTGIKNSSHTVKAFDWKEIESVVLGFGVKTVLEFGSGLSTYLFSGLGCDVTSLEHNPKYMEKVKKFVPGANFIHWPKHTYPEAIRGKKFDMAFIDGASPRMRMLMIAKKHTDLIVMHDIHLKNVGQPLFDEMQTNKGWDLVSANYTEFGVGVFKRAT